MYILIVCNTISKIPKKASSVPWCLLCAFVVPAVVARLGAKLGNLRL